LRSGKPDREVCEMGIDILWNSLHDKRDFLGRLAFYCEHRPDVVRKIREDVDRISRIMRGVEGIKYSLR
jgi:hypothetical protein